MNEITTLSHRLQAETGFHLSRAKFIAQFLVAVIDKRTVNLSELALSISSGVKTTSAYRRLQRFFQVFVMDYELIARLLMNFMAHEPLIISIDRTNWKYGNVDLNIFMLCANYKGIGVPILWDMLPKKGNSNTDERIKLISTFIKIFGKGRIKHLLADREFIGENWFAFLEKEQINFYIRIRNNTLIKKQNGKIIKAYLCFSKNKTGVLHKIRIGESILNLSGKRLKDGEYLIVATNATMSNALNIYKKRWEIEMLFSCLKTRGFRLEESHMKSPEKIKKLIVLLALAFLWCHQTGEEMNDKEPIKIKTHGRKANNLFRYGLDYLRKLIAPFNKQIIWFQMAITLFEQRLSSITLKILT